MNRVADQVGVLGVQAPDEGVRERGERREHARGVRRIQALARAGAERDVAPPWWVKLIQLGQLPAGQGGAASDIGSRGWPAHGGEFP